MWYCEHNFLTCQCRHYKSIDIIWYYSLISIQFFLWKCIKPINIDLKIGILTQYVENVMFNSKYYWKQGQLENDRRGWRPCLPNIFQWVFPQILADFLKFYACWLCMCMMASATPPRFSSLNSELTKQLILAFLKFQLCSSYNLKKNLILLSFLYNLQLCFISRIWMSV